MREKYLRIFFLDLSILFGKFELNQNFISIFNGFVRDNLNKTTIDCFEKIIIVEITEDNSASASYKLEDFVDANDDILSGKIEGIFEGISLEEANEIGEMASAFKNYLESVIDYMSQENKSYQRILKS